MESFRDKIKIAPKDKYKMDSIKAKDFPYYNMYEKDGSIVGKINPKHELRQNKWLQGVSGFVVNEKGEILLEKRTSTGLTPDKIDLVSGHMDKEETPEQAMIRELREEVGIETTKKNSNLEQLGTIPLIFTSRGSKRKFMITFFYCKYNGQAIQKQNTEVDKIMWLPMSEAFDLIRNGKTKFPYDTQLENIFKKVQEQQNKGKERE